MWPCPPWGCSQGPPSPQRLSPVATGPGLLRLPSFVRVAGPSCKGELRVLLNGTGRLTVPAPALQAQSQSNSRSHSTRTQSRAASWRRCSSMIPLVPSWPVLCACLEYAPPAGSYWPVLPHRITGTAYFILGWASRPTPFHPLQHTRLAAWPGLSPTPLPRARFP